MPRSPYGRPGFIALAKSVLESSLRYFDSRLLLLKVESREAVANLSRRAGLIVLSAIFLLFGYLIALVACVSLAASYYETRWEYVAAGAAAGHFALGIIAFLVARTRFSRPLFEHTFREIEKDRQWLQNRKNL